MKKILLPILLFVMFIPFEVGAKEYCKVVSGNGKDIGSEIACGTEHFYIIDSNDDEIKMLAKYNLYTGVSIYKEKIEKEEGDTRTDYQYCNDLAVSKGGTVRTDGIYSQIGYCYYMIPIEEDVILQNENAIGAHVDENGNYLYPQVGDVYHYVGEAGNYNTQITYPNTNFYDYSIDLSNYDETQNMFYYPTGTKPTGVNGPLYFYKKQLIEMGFDVNNISLLSLSELDAIILKISQKRLPFETWNRDINNEFSGSEYITSVNFGMIDEYIPEEYSWLYSTTYWNRSIFRANFTFMNNIYIFVASEGKICGAGFGNCIPETQLGCGIRPVITIPNELQYLIKKETDGNGTIDVVENSSGGEIIQFKVSTNKGYKLRSVLITTDSGEKIEFSEGDIIKNDDGTLSIDKNKFTMPFENVTIQAKFELESILKNPETGAKLLFIILILVVSIGIGTFIYKKKESRYNV